MPKIDSHKFYTAAIKKYAMTPRGVHWLSKENQTLRFDAIYTFLSDDLSNYTIVDAGCGFGDFFIYLQDKKHNMFAYIGIDSHAKMCSLAKKNISQSIINTDICKDNIPNADYYICSGALNILTHFETHLFIRNCYNSSTKAFIFNALYGNKESEVYNYLTKEYILDIAKELNVMQVHFHEGYLKSDITVAFLR